MAALVSVGTVEQSENMAAVVSVGTVEQSENMAAVVSVGTVEQYENMAALVSVVTVEQSENMAAVVSVGTVEQSENMAAVVSVGTVEQSENMAALVSVGGVEQHEQLLVLESVTAYVEAPPTPIGVDQINIGNSRPDFTDQVPLTQTSSDRSSNQRINSLTIFDLGIIAERPKFPIYALKQNRIKSFSNWSNTQIVDSERMSDAGFYHEGDGNVTCFYCGGGIRNWRVEDDIFVEHAKLFGNCGYINQKFGGKFVEVVEELKKHPEKITYKSVTDKMGQFAFSIDNKENRLKRDPAVKALIEAGYQKEEVLNIAHQLPSEDLSADILYEKLDQHLLKERWKPNEDQELSKNKEIKIRELKDSNKKLREQKTCKICMDKEVHVVFLPCGHFVACTECANAIQTCAVCRKEIKAVVRASFTHLS